MRAENAGRIAALRAELEHDGADAFVRRRVFSEDMPLALMHKMRGYDEPPEAQLGRLQYGRVPWTATRQRILGMMAEGMQDAEIAAVLHLSVWTVKGYVKDVLGLLEARNRTHAVHLGWQQGLLLPTSPRTTPGRQAAP